MNFNPISRYIFPMDFQSLLFTLPGIILGLVVHEFFHAWTADKLGDPTPRSLGRLTLNPLKHIDPLGFLFLIVARFGWAKPVECDRRNFRHPALGMSAVALAGPLSNLGLGLIFSLLTVLFAATFPAERSLVASWQIYGITLLDATVQINLGLFLFNLIPIPPLDGSHLWMGWIPEEKAALKYRLYRFGALGFFALLILSNAFNLPVFSFLGKGIAWISQGLYGFWGGLTGISL